MVEKLIQDHRGISNELRIEPNLLIPRTIFLPATKLPGWFLTTKVTTAHHGINRGKTCESTEAPYLNHNTHKICMNSPHIIHN